MKVKTLIEKLSKMNPEAEVRLNDYYGETALFVNARVNNNNIVWLDGEKDIDMKSELSDRYDSLIKKQINEFDFYKDLIETGITVDMVYTYMGYDAANNMEDFCKKNGLL